MKRLLDTFRLTLVSPEMLAVLVVFGAHTYFPALADVLVKPMKEGLGFGLAAAALPLGMLAFNYKEGFDLLSPSGNRKVLLEWDGYHMLKARVVASFVWCIVGALSGIVAIWMVATESSPQFAIALLVAGIFAAGVSTATIALARFTLREIFGE